MYTTYSKTTTTYPGNSKQIEELKDSKLALFTKRNHFHQSLTHTIGEQTRNSINVEITEIEKELREIDRKIEAMEQAQRQIASRQMPATPLDVTVQGSSRVVPFQERARDWLYACFGPKISADKVERNHRFLEEAIELVQATGCTASEAHQLVDYVFGRPVGEPKQEVGGVMVTLAALCLANDMDMMREGEVELERVWGKVEQIRAKQLLKPKHSPLPGPTVIFAPKGQNAAGSRMPEANIPLSGGCPATHAQWIKNQRERDPKSWGFAQLMDDLSVMLNPWHRD